MGDMYSVTVDLIKAKGVEENIQEEFIERGESR